MININQVTKTYGTTKALNNVSLHIEEHSIIGLIGANGAGKSTLMKLIAGHINPDEGLVEVTRQSPYSNICLLSDFEKLLETYSLRKLYKLLPEYYHNFDLAFAKELARDFNVNEKKSYNRLSKGQKGKVNTILALASRSEITLLDETYISLDAPSRHKLFNIILDEFQKHPRTFIISTHYIDEVSRIFDEIVLINQGELLLHEAKDLVESKALTVFCPTILGDELLSQKNIISKEAIGSRTFYSIYDELNDLNHSELEISSTPLEKWFVQMIGGHDV